jgi:hypothetical protein
MAAISDVDELNSAFGLLIAFGVSDGAFETPRCWPKPSTT